MLQILLHTDDGRRQALDVMPGTTLGIDATSPFFDEELRLGTWSLPIELPWTDRNRLLLGAPELLDGVLPPGDGPHWTVDALEFGLPYLPGARMSLLTVAGDAGYRRGTYSMAITGPESEFGGRVAGKTLRDMHLGGRIEWGALSCRDFATTRMQGGLQQWDYVRFAPLRWHKFIDTDRDDYIDEFLHNDRVNQICIVAGAGAFNWSFGRPHPSTGVPVIEGDPLYRDHRTVPFLSLHFVLRSIFAEAGYHLYGDFLEDEDYSDLVVFNNRALEVYNSSNHDIVQFMDPSAHLPDIDVAEFLATVQNTFGFGFFPRAGSRMQIRYRTAPLGSNAPPRDLSRFALAEYTGERPTGDGGYTMGWRWESADELKEEVPDTIDLALVRAEVSTFNNLAGISLTPAAQPGDLAYVSAENQYYAWQPGGGWSYAYTGQQPAVVDGGENEKILDASSLVYDTSADLCATSQPGTYVNSSRKLVEAEFGLRFFYIRAYDKPMANAVPVSFSHNYDPQGVKRVQTSLSWTAIEGLFARHHRSWFEAMRRTWTVGMKLALPPGESLDFAEPVRIGQQHYLVKSQRPEVGSGAPVEVELLKI